MKPFTYHNHTTFCDGKNTVEEMVLSAIAHGCDSIGLSEHSFVSIDHTYGIFGDEISIYRSEVQAAKEKYKDKINVFLGIEQDVASDTSSYTDAYDYKIGSVHSVRKNGGDYSIDSKREDFEMVVYDIYGGDVYTFCEDYFKRLETVYDVTKCDIVGHIDLVAKFNENGEYFDENNERYVAAAEKAIKKLASDGVIFEMNTGAISRGYRKTPYPAKRLLEAIKREGGRITYSSDCHAAESILCGYEDAVKIAKECGFEGFMKLVNGEFKLVRFDD